MAVELLKIGLKIGKFVILLPRTCFRSVCSHPFFMCMVLFLLFLHRSLPFLFSLFVSASPVFVCTSILLGTLLIFGKPNIPERKKEDKTSHKIVSRKTVFQRESGVVERDETHAFDWQTNGGRDLVANSSFTEIDPSDGDKDDEGFHLPVLSKESSRDIQSDNMAFEETERKHDSFKLSSDSRIHRIVEKRLSSSQAQTAGNENCVRVSSNAPGLIIESPKEDHLECLGSPWQVQEDENNEVSDSGWSRADEDSSPDASMSGFIPILDELHPLLDEDAPPVSHDGSDADSECSPGSAESDENDGDGDDNDEGEDEDEYEDEKLHGEREDASASAIKWTEDDQKNVMNLGTSELERNQHLENLIARRIARRTKTENLIDFNAADHSFNVAPISTRKQNPFDVSPDPNELSVPGSAPSLWQGRSPFYLPYDSIREKSDVAEDSLQQDFLSFQPRDPLFRRHESFNVGMSFFGASRQDVRLRPYFVPERTMASEGTSYSNFQSQSGELSDSKTASITETESSDSEMDVEDKVFEGDLSPDPDIIAAATDHASEHISHGTESSNDVESVELGQADSSHAQLDETESKLVDVENHLEMGSDIFESESVANPLVPNPIVKVFHEGEGEGSLNLEQSSYSVNKLSIRTQTSEDDDTQHKGPIYDSSPPAIKKYFSFSASSSVLPVTAFPPVIVKRANSFAERESHVTASFNNANGSSTVPQSPVKQASVDTKASSETSVFEENFIENELAVQDLHDRSHLLSTDFTASHHDIATLPTLSSDQVQDSKPWWRPWG